jgi:hypothetical protein
MLLSRSKKRLSNTRAAFLAQVFDLEVRVWSFLRRVMQIANNSCTIQRLWGGAVNILEENDCDLTQQLPRDLDTEDKDYNDRHYIKAITKRHGEEAEEAEKAKELGKYRDDSAHSVKEEKRGYSNSAQVITV